MNSINLIILSILSLNALSMNDDGEEYDNTPYNNVYIDDVYNYLCSSQYSPQRPNHIEEIVLFGAFKDYLNKRYETSKDKLGDLVAKWLRQYSESGHNLEEKELVDIIRQINGNTKTYIQLSNIQENINIEDCLIIDRNNVVNYVDNNMQQNQQDNMTCCCCSIF